MGTKEATSEGTEVRERVRVKEPPLYQVLLLNDDYTTMEFVILVLEQIFRKTAADAERIMLAVHKNGLGVAGVYTKEIAETKVTAVHHLARQHEYPLRCAIEPV